MLPASDEMNFFSGLTRYESRATINISDNFVKQEK